MDNALNDLLKEIDNKSNDELSNSDKQVKRLLSKQWNNPFDVFMLNYDASESEINKRYRIFAKTLYPDICSHPKATEAFEVVKTAYDILKFSEKKYVYQKIMKEAYERTWYSRKIENDSRQKKGIRELPEDTFDIDYQINCRKLFDEIQNKKNQIKKIEISKKLRQEEELNYLSLKEQYKILTEKEWEETRNDRIKKWKNFKKSEKKDKNQINLYPNKDKFSIQKTKI